MNRISDMVKGNEELNFEDTFELAKAAVKNGVERFIFASSASVYGFNESQILNESAKLNPISNYASSKFNAEECLRDIDQDKMKVVVLRKGTIMGTSRRMRFDLVVNAMVMQAMYDKKIPLQGGGQVWRPLVSIRDVVDLYTILIEMPDDKFAIMANGFEYNVVGENYRISELALRIKEWFGDKNVDVIPNTREKGDSRSYRISSVKLDPYFKCRTTLDETISDIHTWIMHKRPEKNDPIYYNVKWVKMCEEVCAKMSFPFTLLKR